jgi:lipid-A-disaccharide synthase
MKYYIIAGEMSGDLHGSHFIRELKMLDPSAQIRAWGGDRMKEAGAEVVKHYKDHNFMGFIEVILHLRKITENLRFCKKDILAFTPDVIVLIDFPGFNLRIAKWAKKQGFRVIYYISPQVWAWKSSRVNIIRETVDKMITILPFEKDFYAKFNFNVEYVGHPLLDSIPDHQHETTGSKHLITLLPGSRKQEIQRMLPIMTSVISHFPDFEFVIAGVSSVDESFYRKYSQGNIRIEFDQLYSLLANSRAALVTSGTATLETALNNVPLIVCYKSNLLSYHIAKRLIKVKYISLVNLIMDRPVVKEFIQASLTQKNLIDQLQKLAYDDFTRNAIFADYSQLKSILGNSGASSRAALLVFNYLKEEGKL